MSKKKKIIEKYETNAQIPERLFLSEGDDIRFNNQKQWWTVETILDEFVICRKYTRWGWRHAVVWTYKRDETEDLYHEKWLRWMTIDLTAFSSIVDVAKMLRIMASYKNIGRLEICRKKPARQENNHEE